MSLLLIDATHYAFAGATGVENYVAELLPRLSMLMQERGWSVAWVGHGAKSPKGKPKGVRWIASPHVTFWSERVLPDVLKKEKPDIFFTPSGIPPRGYKGVTALTVHDMAVYRFPKAFTWKQRLQLKPRIKRAALRAKCILTVSKYSETEIKKFWSVSPNVITVTPLGYSPTKAKPQPIPDIDISLPILAFVSRVEAKKNVGRVIEAFAALDTDAQLVLAGKPGHGFKEIEAQIAKLPAAVRERIVVPGYITDGQREWLFSHATVALVPGSVEGASLPLLEAFAHGVPALCAKAGPLPEIADTAALYAAPHDTAAWSRQMHKYLKDAKLRATYSKLGKERVASFSWDTTAALTAEALVA